ncbi:MAG: type II secretion system minor pseudopilin GspI [Gammaproteobacteria bacterium]
MPDHRSHRNRCRGRGPARARARGFTLLEVLIALAVLAIALAALIQSAGGYASNEIYLRDRTTAQWVAHNVLTEWQLKGDWPSVGEKHGTRDFDGRTWDWRVKVSQTQDKDLRRLDVTVRPDGADDKTTPLGSLTGFVGHNL